MTENEEIKMLLKRILANQVAIFNRIEKLEAKISTNKMSEPMIEASLTRINAASERIRNLISD